MPEPSAQVGETTGSVDEALGHAERLVSTDPELAIEQLDEFRHAGIEHPRADLLRARALAMQGRTADAEALLLALRAAQPAWIPPLEDHALLLIEGDRLVEARDVLEKAVAIEPRAPRLWVRLADLARAAGEAAKTDQMLAEHVSNAAFDPVLRMAADALNGGRLAEAEKRLRDRLREMPTDVAAIRMLAEVAVRIGRTEDAEALLARCLELAPGFTAARQNYAMVLHRANKPADALREIDTLLGQNPEDPSHLNLRAVVLCRTGDYAEGIRIYQSLLQRYPDQGRIWLSFGHALKTAGERDGAVAAYRRCLEMDPRSGEAWWSLANLKTFRFSAADLRTMQGIEREKLDPEQCSQLDFALGKALEDVADYPASFAHYDAGNALRRRLMPYRSAEATARVDRAKALFNREFFAQRHGWGCASDDPIFIVGMPRAGSTLVEQILSSHPAIEGTMELPEIISITRDLRHAGGNKSPSSYHDALAVMDSAACAAMGQRYLERTRIQRKQDRPHFIDKMPNNFFHVGLIHLILPNARIIDVRRHPLACCFSGFKQYFARGQNFSYSLEDIGAYYRDYVELMRHFDAELPGRIHRVIYEELVDDVETAVRALLDYCGLPFADECLRFFENDRAVRTASSEQVRQPIYREGVNHWRHFEPWLDPLKGVLGPVLTEYPNPPGPAALHDNDAA
ncbi:MAG TPA: sulfotransferase [Candidatus Competibacter sp.]|nr:sulfotransferase [Xanthomonadales bacterium]HPE72795.1 sulfotransferase [Candidatus Competibacter sp.]